MDAQREAKESSSSSSKVGEGRGCTSVPVQKKDPLLIKIKISMPGQLASQENRTQELKDQVFRTCEYCGKTFMNGKALGGHVRIHNQEGKLKGVAGAGGATSRKLKRKIDELELGSRETEDAAGHGEEQLLHSCCICERKFPTNKSLCGHMRFHPERSWRGVQPPKVTEGEGEVHEEVDDDIRPFSEGCDLLKDLTSWSKTEKRGQSSSVNVEAEADCGLMKLARAISDDLSSSDVGEGDQVPGLKEEDEDEEDPWKIESSVPPVIHENKAATQFRFQCITCHKIFPSYQALGGHRSIHSKDRGISTHPSKISLFPDMKIITENKTVKEEHDVPCRCQGGKDDSRCKICRGKFPTSHTGCPDQDCGAGSASPADEASSTGPRLVLQIDLNVIPTNDFDDEEEALDSKSKS